MVEMVGSAAERDMDDLQTGLVAVFVKDTVRQAWDRVIPSRNVAADRCTVAEKLNTLLRQGVLVADVLWGCMEVGRGVVGVSRSCKGFRGG